jgi:hypothetical protein
MGWPTVGRLKRKFCLRAAVGWSCGTVLRRLVAPIAASDAAWAIRNAREVLAGVKALQRSTPPRRFS